MITKPRRKVAKTILSNKKIVSTVFLGIDHNFNNLNGKQKPLLFETMVFSNEKNFDELDVDRYSTWEEAKKGHKKMVEKWGKNKVD